MNSLRRQQSIMNRTGIIVVVLVALVVIAIGVAIAKTTDAAEETPTTTQEVISPAAMSTTPTTVNDWKSAQYALLTVPQGRIVIELFPDAAPKTVTNFVTLANRGYYNKLLFHRIVKDFVIQGGDPNGNGSGGESIYGDTFADEINPQSLDLPEDKIALYQELYGYSYRSDLSSIKITKGVVAMANRGANTNGSQFFIVTGDIDGQLDGKHTAFGKVVEGQEVVDRLNQVEVDARDNRPKEPVVIERIVTGNTIDELKAKDAQ